MNIGKLGKRLSKKKAHVSRAVVPLLRVHRKPSLLTTGTLFPIFSKGVARRVRIAKRIRLHDFLFTLTFAVRTHLVHLRQNSN